MKLSLLAAEGGGTLHGGDPEIGSLCADSRVAGEGDLFFCINGTQEDAHTYAAEAERRGSAALVCEKKTDTQLPYILVPDCRRAMAHISAAFYGHPEKYMKMIAVTGTNGKTTVAHMIHAILTAAGKRAGLVGTLGAKFGRTFLPASLTTPDPISLFSLLSDMRKDKVEFVAMEVSAHALALRKDCPIVYESAIFTNLTQDHLDFFSDMRSYGEAKKSLFSRCRLAIVNSDDKFSAEISNVAPATLTYGLDGPADCFAMIEREGLDGTKALLNLEDDLCEAELPMTGRHNVSNALAAAACCKNLGIGMEHIAEGLSKVRVEGRLEHIGTYRGADLFVDFAHTPDGLEKSLKTLKEHAEGRLFVVFGCGGNRDRAKRPLMGKVVAEHCDFAVITSDNPRYEDPCAIISEIEGGFQAVSRNYVAVEEREKAIAYAFRKLREGDILLVAGKGGETEQEIMGIKYSYSDKAVLKSLMGRGNVE